MHANSKVSLQQRRKLKSIRSKSNSVSCFNMLTSDALLDRVEQLLPQHRERLFPPTQTLSMYLAQVMSADRSCQNVVNQCAMERLVCGLPECSVNTGAYCRARQRLPLELIETLTRQVASMIEAQSPPSWLWQGKRVLLVDGTTAIMPDTAANQRRFPQQTGQLPGCGFPICRVVGITSLASGALLNAAVGPYQGQGSSELSLLRQMLDTFEPGDLLLADAFYAAYFILAALQARGVDVLMEQNAMRRRQADYRNGRRLGARDHVITLRKPRRPDWMNRADYQAAPATIEVRELHAGGKTLVTTMTDQRIAKKELKSLYAMRWQVELDIRSIKTDMGMQMLSCKTPDQVEKEILVYLLAYNLIRWVMAQSAIQVDLRPRDLSFKHCQQLWLIARMHPDAPQEAILTLVAKQRVGLRPHRIEPRAVKRRRYKYPLLSVPRAQARQMSLWLDGSTNP